jgi:hypothetical protein
MSIRGPATSVKAGATSKIGCLLPPATRPVDAPRPV